MITKNSYQLMSPLAFLSPEDYQTRVNELELDKDKFPCIFLKINDNPFKDWCVEITDVVIQDHGGFGISYNLIAYPKEITEAIVENSKERFGHYITKIVLDIFSQTYNEGK